MIFQLHRNMRLNQGQSEEKIKNLKRFAEWVLKVGNDQISPPTDALFDYEEDDILILPDFCDPELSNSVGNMKQWTYPDFLKKYRCSDYLSERAILTPTNQIVNHLNSLIIDIVPGPEITYYSVHRAEDFGGTISELSFAFPPEYLYSINLNKQEISVLTGISTYWKSGLNVISGLKVISELK
ncbi:hypothetical protein AgCh_022209 [Apium graveolens]